MRRLFSLRGLSARIGVNLVAFVLFAVAVTFGALISYASGVFFDDSYPVTVGLPEAGGVLPDQEVTVLGDAVGQVADVEIVEEGVLITLDIDGGSTVPSRADVRVLRRSPIGEQAVELAPVAQGWRPAEAGERIDAVSTTTPASVPFLLEQTVDLFDAIDTNDLGTLLEELALALDGRGEQLKQLNRDSIDLNETIIGGIPEFERLIDTSEGVLRTLDEHAQDLTALFSDGADLAEVLADNRPTIERLLDTAPRALTQTQALVINTRANLQCLTNDLTSLNNMLLGPSTATGQPARLYDSKLDELDAALRTHRQFFQVGFSIIPQPDPTTGVGWTRVQLVVDQEQTGQKYPEKRDTPPTLPGAACVADTWGTGVNAVRQADAQPADPTSPGILFAPLVDPIGPGTVTPEELGLIGAPGSSGGGAGGAGGGPALPATGGGLAGIALLSVAAAVASQRRRDR